MYFLFGGLFYTLSFIIQPACFTNVIGPKDYCEHENFEARCSQNQVIMMHSATYGRMSVGRCIGVDFGIGCSMNALPVMDELCSGLTSCSVSTIVDPVLVNAKIKGKVCPTLSAYLVASYSCIPVIQSSEGHCKKGHKLIVKNEGYILSHYASETGNGGPHCPWKLQVAGNIVNITLHKFPKQSEDSLLAPASSLCYEIGRIKEGREQKNIMVCGSDPRHKMVYISHGGDIEISFTEKAVLDTLGRFLVSYTASQCVIPEVPNDSHASIQGNVIVIQCNNSNTKWEVDCQEVNKWKIQNHKCPTVKHWSIEDLFPHDTISAGIVIAVAIGLTVVICAVGFFFYLFYYYCKRCKENAAHQRAVNTRDYTDEDKKGAENLIKFPPENDVKYRENTLKSNAGSSDTSSLDKRTISWPIRESFRHSSHADTLQFPDENESESVSVEDETMNSHVPSEEVPINVPDYGKPLKM